MTIEFAGRTFTRKERITARMRYNILRYVDSEKPVETYSPDAVQALMTNLYDGNHEGVDWAECDASTHDEALAYFFEKVNKKTNESQTT